MSSYMLPYRLHDAKSRVISVIGILSINNLSKFTSSTNNHHTVLFTDDASLLSKGDDKQSLEQSFGLLSSLFITWSSTNNCYLNGFNAEIPKFSTQPSSQYQYHIDLQPKDTHHSTKFSSKTIFNGIPISISFVKKLNSSIQALRQLSSICTQKHFYRHIF